MNFIEFQAGPIEHVIRKADIQELQIPTRNDKALGLLITSNGDKYHLAADKLVAIKQDIMKEDSDAKDN